MSLGDNRIRFAKQGVCGCLVVEIPKVLFNFESVVCQAYNATPMYGACKPMRLRSVIVAEKFST